jgi:vacuolar-type H+-ATPase subunit H
MVVTSLHKENMMGEHARCLFKMSEALYQVPGKELQADRFLKEAEELYWQRVGEPEHVAEEDQAEYETPLRELKEDDYDNLVYMEWR